MSTLTRTACFCSGVCIHLHEAWRAKSRGQEAGQPRAVLLAKGYLLRIPVVQIELAERLPHSLEVMAYYPLHFIVSAIFAPMFIQVERPGRGWCISRCRRM